MESCLVKKLSLHYEPVAVLLSNEKPEGALQSKEGKWSCIIPLFIAAAKGKISVFERKTTECPGGKVGLGFGQYPNYPDGIEYFLSVGKSDLFEGEGYKKNPELGGEFVNCLPITDIPYQYVIFKPLSQIDTTKEKPELIVFYVNTNQLSALTTLANYYRPGNENVMIPFGSGCQSIFLLPYAEAQKENPRAVVGLTDITVRPMLEADMLSFSVPYKMFLYMEENVEGSFLEKHLWHRVVTKMEKVNKV
ncbi:DUF169 domain-containing protein [Clostridium magnum]|uniref:DUF169 domain-containing protein n=1 Tax=Clostridium magnum DSM 2767 TaxID=1121326 RepID=A0A162TJ16_9CLOT|nr:DUF169 domain-containing protein [Clostridium magnum]KZL92707.1 hypothetical protein CLMAG_25210 [Clostridium magnum DSM 2767]SHI24654.1 Uncharacterized conserved protein, DUF169 family [Clostridium magnum DSM 2767]